MRALVVVLVSCLLPLAASCASSGAAKGPRTGGTDARFPSSDELRALAERPAPAALGDAQGQWDVSAWTLTGPLPDGVALTPHEPVNDVERMLEAAAGGRADVALSEGMHCVAREVGRFFLAHDAYPGDRVRSFIVGRCGATAIQVQWRSINGDLTGFRGERLLPEEWYPDVQTMIAAVIGRGAQELGVAVVREGSRVVVLAAAGLRRAVVEPLPLVPDEHGIVEVRGTILTRADRVSALITQGRFEAVECAADPEVKLPRFAFSCPTAVSDALARIEIGAYVEGRLLGDRIADFLARPDGGSGERYQRIAYAPPRVASDSAHADDALLELLNGVREDAGLAPVRLAPAQHATAKRLAPHFFGALLTRDQGTRERVALGMMAGWDVRGIVQRGSIAWSLLQRSRDLSELLAAGLESPSARAALLDADADQVALGVVMLPKEDTVAALFGTYSVYQPTAFEEDAARAYSVLAKRRDAAGADPQRRLTKAEPIVLELAQAIEDEDMTTSEALAALSRMASAATNRSVIAFVLPTRELEELEVPPDLLLKPAVDVALAVARTRDEGEAWGHLVVLVVMAVDGPVRTARAAPLTSPAPPASCSVCERASPAT